MKRRAWGSGSRSWKRKWMQAAKIRTGDIREAIHKKRTAMSEGSGSPDDTGAAPAQSAEGKDGEPASMAQVITRAFGTGEKLGVIDVGGGMRGAYGAGIFDFCLEQGIEFDYGIGVSAGSANIVTYIARQHLRTKKFYTEYAFRKEYMGLPRLIRTGSFINLDYIFGDLSNHDGEYPLDYEAVMANPMEFLIVTADAEDGSVRYFTKDDLKQDDYAPIKGSSCVPVVDKPYMVQGRPYFDGGLVDPIPIEKAFADGCDRVVVVLTRPRNQYRVPDKDVRMSKLIRRKYPAIARRLAGRAQLYNGQLDLIKKYETEGKVLIIAPADINGMSTLGKNKEATLRMYHMGHKDAEAILDFLK